MIKKLLFPTIAFVALTVAVFATPNQGQASHPCSETTCPFWGEENCIPFNGFHCIENGPVIACELCL